MQLAAFLAWSREGSELHTAWHVLAMTGMRRGELLALRWRDIGLDAATVSIGHSVGVVRNKGEGSAIAEGDTKSGKPRVINIDPGTAAVLRSWKRDRGAWRSSSPVMTPSYSATSRAGSGTRSGSAGRSRTS
jgi:integrase